MDGWDLYEVWISLSFPEFPRVSLVFLESKGSIGSYPVPDPEDPPRPDSKPEQIQLKVRSGIYIEDDICTHLLNLPDSPLEPEPEESIESDFSVPSHSTII